MIELGFEIIRTPYPPQSGMTGIVTQKRRLDGRVGATVGDEAKLWDALQEALKANAELKAQLEAAQKKGRKQ